MESYDILPIRRDGGFVTPPPFNCSLDMIWKGVASNLAPVMEPECILSCVK
jgi:hypothetical protein